MNDDTLLKLREWEASIKTKNLEKTVETVAEVKKDVEAVKRDAEAVADVIEEKLKDGFQVDDVTETLKSKEVQKFSRTVEEVTQKCCLPKKKVLTPV